MWPLWGSGKCGEGAGSGSLLTGDLGLCLLLPLNRLAGNQSLVGPTHQQPLGMPTQIGGQRVSSMWVFSCSRIVLWKNYHFAFIFKSWIYQKFIFCNVGSNLISLLIDNKWCHFIIFSIHLATTALSAKTLCAGMYFSVPFLTHLSFPIATLLQQWEACGIFYHQMKQEHPF